MKILFLSHYFPPEVNAPATRGYEHCRAWVEEGHEVTVVTCAPNHPFGELYEGYKNRYSVEYKDGIKIIRIKTFMSANEGFIRRTLAYLSFMFSAIFQCFRFGNHDVVLSTSPQFFNGLAGYFVSRLRGLPWVLEIRDLWPDSILAVGAIKNKFIIKILYKIEKLAYKHCDHIVTVTDSFKEYMIDIGIRQSKITVIKNGVDLAFFDSTSERLNKVSTGTYNVIGNGVLQDKFVASYVGTHGMAHRLETLLDAADLIKHRKDIHFLLVGGGAERERLIEIVREKNLKNVTMLGQRPKTDMPWIWSKTDASIVHLKKDDVFKSVIPSKIFESMAMRKPIILGVEGESAGMIQEADSGIVVEPENSKALAEAVIALADDKAKVRCMGENGRDYVESNFDRNVLARVFEHILSRVVDNDSGTGSSAAIEIDLQREKAIP